MGVLEHWSVDFYDFTVPDQLRNDPDVPRFGGLHERAARNGARHGTPVILSPSGRPDHRVNLFFREGKMAASEPGTWRRYAYTLIVWFDFLDAIGRSWDDATVRDVEAFKDRGPTGALAASGPGGRPSRSAPDHRRAPPRQCDGRRKGHRMTNRRVRDREAERAALRSAADRLLVGTPLRSETGRLTATELLRESNLSRDVAYGDHRDLIEEFQARVKAQNATPAAMQELADRYGEVKEKLVAVTKRLANEQAVSAALRRIVAELDLELAHAREQLEQSGTVTRLPAARRRHRSG
ncbi:MULTISPECIES: hypothetical protein [unclassified Streptomyces]|uniref:hypothetical protein n=1 Tax=unclassified Streptomyces TaxID=2593676 RepID=UPI001E54D308|nr:MULTISPECIES: hypothetical protein [unclassified Streptomyces]